MSTLAELLQPVTPRTLAAARAYLDAVITVPDSTPVTSNTVMSRLSLADSKEVFDTLKTQSALDSRVAEAMVKLRDTGLDLSHANARAMIDSLFAASLAAKVKALGEKSVPRWSQLGFKPKDGHILEVL